MCVSCACFLISEYWSPEILSSPTITFNVSVLMEYAQKMHVWYQLGNTLQQVLFWISLLKRLITSRT